MNIMDAHKRDLCRLCLGSINGCDEMVLNDNRHLIKSIWLITGLEVVSDPGQCEYVCSQCQSLLEQCVEFRDKCINNDSVYRGMMTGSNYVEDCKSEIQKPLVEYIKQEPIDLEEAADCVDEVLQNSHTLPDDGDDHPIEMKQDSEEEADYGTELLKKIQSSNRKKLYCKHCSKEYLDLKDLKQHITAHHTKYTCDKCGKPFVNRNTFMEHCRLMHSGEKRYACQVCGERFLRTSMRTYHQRKAHPTFRPFSCEYCDKSFQIRRELNLHISCHAELLKTKTKSSPKVVQCQECDKTVSLHNLSTHQKIHNSTRKKLCCPHCPKVYLHNKDLKEHIHVNHTKGIQYGCVECGKTYETRRSFNEHQAAYHSAILC